MACREDNGLCLVKLAKPAGASWAYIQFHDQSVYKVEPVSDEDAFSIPTRKDQPGCWFNCDLSKRDKYQYTRLHEWPKIPDFGWISLSW